LTACQNVWIKPNAAPGEFEQARYQCLQESQQRVGVASVNQYGGSAVDSVKTNGMLFNSCMQAKGWSLQNKDAAQAQIAQIQANSAVAQSQATERQHDLVARLNEICNNPELKAYYAKSSCKANEVTFEQLADGTKITPTQKAVLLKQRAAVDSYEKETISMLRSRGGAQDKHVADILETTSIPQNIQNNLDLYNGKITWGEYNQKRRDIYNNFQIALKR
jgi:hypothetical protein